ncbi:hypothetical protein M9Y10_032321 [Tritrichomonas musculus]|uniref:Uncharacterized protein n=1 Tax=Tritrichomonas musculus TaxID=1915356 RepID=A0ABR2GZK9_9EUKA
MNSVCKECKDGLIPNEDGSECVVKTCMDLEITEKIGCVSCNESDPIKCGSCDESLHFVLVDGKCECSSKDGYQLTNGICMTEEQKSCLASISYCSICSDSTHCATCYDTYKNVDGKCEKTNCDKIENCDSCREVNGNLQCVTCKGEYKPSHDKTQCVIPTEQTCTNSLLGCDKCSNVNNTKCYKCDHNNHFTETPANADPSNPNIDVRCVCESGFELVGSACLPPIEPVPPPQPALPTETITNYESMFEDHANPQSTNLTFNSDYPFKNDITYVLSVSADNELVAIPEKVNVSSVSLKLGQRENQNSPVQIVAPKVESVNVEFSKDSSIQIPPQSQNIDLSGQGKLTVFATDSSNSIEIGKVTPSGNSDGMIIESNVSEIKLDQVQVFGQTSLTGQEDGLTKCSNLVLESGSDFTIEKVSLEKVFIGLLSTLNFEKPNVTVENSEFKVYFNRTLNQRHYPIRVKRDQNNKINYPDFTKISKLYMSKLSAGDYIDILKEEEEEFLIAHFEDADNDRDAIYQNCLDLADKYEYSEGFGNQQCVNSTTDSVFTDLIVKKSDPPKKPKKKGLSGGAIAGIVIACVVVVAAIIALLVYFLVIKKRNQSTTSTQGDSSIAI